MNDAINAGTGTTFRQYRRKQIAELRPWKPGDDMTGISVSAEDARVGSPMLGDMIARNPKNHADQWLVATLYFVDNFEPVEVAADALSTPKATVERGATHGIGRWLSAALDDPTVCAEMKADINAWFVAGQPNVQPRLDEAAIREKAFEDAAMIARQVAINAERRSADHANLDAKQSALDKMAGAQEAEARIRQAASAIRGGKQP